MQVAIVCLVNLVIYMLIVLSQIIIYDTEKRITVMAVLIGIGILLNTVILPVDINFNEPVNITAGV